MSEFNPLPQPGTAPASLGQRFDYLRGFLQRQYLAILLGLVDCPANRGLLRAHQPQDLHGLLNDDD